MRSWVKFEKRHSSYFYLWCISTLKTRLSYIIAHTYRHVMYILHLYLPILLKLFLKEIYLFHEKKRQEHLFGIVLWVLGEQTSYMQVLCLIQGATSLALVQAFTPLGVGILALHDFTALGHFPTQIHRVRRERHHHTRTSSCMHAITPPLWCQDLNLNHTHGKAGALFDEPFLWPS